MKEFKLSMKEIFEFILQQKKQKSRGIFLSLNQFIRIFIMEFHKVNCQGRLEVVGSQNI